MSGMSGMRRYMRALACISGYSRMHNWNDQNVTCKAEKNDLGYLTSTQKQRARVDIRKTHVVVRAAGRNWAVGAVRAQKFGERRRVVALTHEFLVEPPDATELGGRSKLYYGVGHNWSVRHWAELI